MITKVGKLQKVIFIDPQCIGKVLKQSREGRSKAACGDQF